MPSIRAPLNNVPRAENIDNRAPTPNKARQLKIALAKNAVAPRVMM
jgi:hypothetical protein